MAIKTVQIFDPGAPIDLSPTFDRLNPAIHPDGREKLIDLVNRGELPRYRGDETQIVVTDTEITVTMTWQSLSVAQEYLDFCVTWAAANDTNNWSRSIEIVQD